MTAAAFPRLITLGRVVEDTLVATALLLMGGLPVLELILRTVFHTGIPGNTGYVANLTLWVGFLGAMIASRERRHLDFASGIAILSGRSQRIVRAIAAAASAAVASGLFWASLDFVRSDAESPVRIGGWLPMWAVESILPASFVLITLRFVIMAGGWWERAAALCGVPAAAAIGLLLGSYAPHIVWPLIACLVALALFGAPIFVVLGGAALLLFFADGVPVAALPVETYRLVVSPAIPTIPLFTLTGFVLAEGQASERLVRLFRAFFGWMPGGLAIVTTLVCAFFTTFTGASGVMILALGGLLLPVLLRSGYPERFSLGLLTSTGSIGILFPPSLAVILFGMVAHVSIADLFKAGIVPGLIMVGAVCLYGVYKGLWAKAPRQPFELKEAGAAIWQAKWEILLPVIVVGGIFGGLSTLIEAAAISVVYALFIETVIHRELHPIRDLPRVLVKSGALIGGVFVILGVAMGLTNYLVDAQVPMRATAWVQSQISSQLVFLLALNVFLLIVGCLMDIFSAIVVVVPLILPLAQAYGIHPLHLGMIFLINLELGYLTPPVGLNLFLASYRFGKPLIEVYRSALPFLLVLLFVVLLITYVPALTIGAD